MVAHPEDWLYIRQYPGIKKVKASQIWTMNSI